MLPGILQVLTTANQLLGPDVVPDLIKFFTTRFSLTPEQVANLDSNYRDYVERIAKLRAEIQG